MLRFGREKSWAELKGELESNYNAESIERVLTSHPAVCGANGVTATGIRRYAKTWLEQKYPSLAVDYLEAEINIAFAYVVPIMVAPYVILGFTSLSSALFWLASIMSSLLLGILLVAAGNRLRYATEPYETVFGFLMAHWIDADAVAPAGQQKTG